MKRTLLIFSGALLIAGCASSDPDSDVEPENGASEKVGISQDALSEVDGCHFYVGSSYGGTTKWMARGTTIPDLHAYSMGDKISSVRLRGGATTRMWIDKNYQGNNWFISADVATLHTAQWGNLGDNASSADCY